MTKRSSPFAFAEAAIRGTDLVAIHAPQNIALETALGTNPGVDQVEGRVDEERTLAEALSGWSVKEPDVRVRGVVVHDGAARALTAASKIAQVLVVGRRARRGPGSTTHGALHRATCPVAVVPTVTRDSR